MDRLFKTLIERLKRKGMELGMAQAYMRDMANAMASRPQLNLEELNRRLRLLGWNDFELDDHTMQLIIANFETHSPKKPAAYFDSL